jgi:hypothetical protein
MMSGLETVGRGAGWRSQAAEWEDWKKRSLDEKID